MEFVKCVAINVPHLKLHDRMVTVSRRDHEKIIQDGMFYRYPSLIAFVNTDSPTDKGSPTELR